MDAARQRDMLDPVAASLRMAGIARPDAVPFSFNGIAVQAPAGESLAAALIAAGMRGLGAGPGAPRAALCMMGTCQQCLVRVDGRLAQACLTRVRPGLEVTAA
jgi:predicted molibdopterin-dependent oxidoreductase YjgC